VRNPESTGGVSIARPAAVLPRNRSVGSRCEEWVMQVATAEGQASPLLRVQPTAIWRTLRNQPASFWLINIYLMLEYVRPQQVWEFLDVAPVALLTLTLTIAAFFVEGKSMRLSTGAGALL